MAAPSAYFLLLALHFLSTNAEFKVCSTLDDKPACKKIEASRTDVKCVAVADSVECIRKLQRQEVDVGVFSPEEGLFASNFLGSTVDVVAEVRSKDRKDHAFAFQTVVIVKTNSTGGLEALNGSAYCHPGFSRSRYWTDRVLKAFELKILELQNNKCTHWRNVYEDEADRLSKFFRKSCRPGSWVVNSWWDNKLKKDFASLCAQCDHPSRCAYAQQNSGDHAAALRCLTQGGGDVAYTAFEFVQEYFNLGSGYQNTDVNVSDFRFLCQDGTTRTLASTDPCAWVKQPWTSVVALRNVSSKVSTSFTEWFPEEAARRLDWAGNLKQILTKDRGVLKILDKKIGISDYIAKGRTNPTSGKPCRASIKWCTSSTIEQEKCEYVKAAAQTHGVLAELECVIARTKQDCLKKVYNSEADIVVIDTQLGFIARKVYNLTAVAYLETERTSNYYGVAVVKGNSITKFEDLEGRKGCFPEYNGLGWLSFVQTARNMSLIPNQLCSDTRSVWDFFSKVCAPGSKNESINPLRAMTPEKMCSACGDASCVAAGNNKYYGEVGALRCLNSGNGDVAFLDFYAIKRFFESDRHNTSDAEIKPEKFKLLCKDGSTADWNLEDPDDCSLSQLNGGEVVTRSEIDVVRRRDISLTLQELDDWFGTNSRHYDPVLKMYEPFDGHSNVLFKESTVALVSARETQSHFVNNYAGLLYKMDHCYKDSGSGTISKATVVFVFALFLALYKL